MCACVNNLGQRTGDCQSHMYVCIQVSLMGLVSITSFLWTSISLPVKTRLSIACEKLLCELFPPGFSTSPHRPLGRMDLAFYFLETENTQHSTKYTAETFPCLEHHFLPLSKAGVPKHWRLSGN